MKRFRFLVRSATAPAGKVRKKKGNEAAVAISDSSKGDAPDAFMSQVAAVSCADTQMPESTLANQSPLKTRFPSASHTEVFCFGELARCMVQDEAYLRCFKQCALCSGEGT